MFISPVAPPAQHTNDILYDQVLRMILPAGKLFPFMYSVIVFILLFTQAILFDRLINKQRLFPKPNYLTGMSYLLFTSLFPCFSVLSAPLIICTFLLFILSRLFTLYNSNTPKSTLFNLGLLVGLSTLFYFPSLAFLLLVLFGLTTTRTFKLPEWIVFHLGLLSVYYFLYSFYFLTGTAHAAIRFDEHISNPFKLASKWEVVAMGFILTLALVGFIFVQNFKRRLLVQSRKNWQMIMVFLFLSLLTPFLNGSPSLNDWIIVLLPFSALAAVAFIYPEKKWFSFFIHTAMIVLVVMIGYLHLKH